MSRIVCLIEFTLNNFLSAQNLYSPPPIGKVVVDLLAPGAYAGGSIQARAKSYRYDHAY